MFQLIKYLILLSTLFSQYILAQDAEFIKVKEYKEGVNFITNKPFYGLEFNCNEEIINIFLDDSARLMVIESKVENKLNRFTIYDTNDKQIYWNGTFNPNKERLLVQDKYIVLSDNVRTLCYDKISGKEIWSYKKELIYVNDKNDVALTYFSHFDRSQPDILLEAIRLKDGKKIWTRKIDRTYGWNEVLSLNDSTILLSASGLHLINLKNSKGWDFDALTGEEKDRMPNSFAINTAAAFIGVGFGLVGYGVFRSIYYFSHTSELYWDLCSNVVNKEGTLYYASKKTITALELNGKVKWQTQLPKEITGNSDLVLIDSMLLMINKGYAAIGKSRCLYGTAYLAAFNIFSGKQKYLKQINLAESAITDFKLKNGVTYLLETNKIAGYDLNTGSFLNREMISELAQHKNGSFISSASYIMKKNTKSCYIQDTLLCLYLPDEGIMEFDFDLHQLRNIKTEDIYFKHKINDTLSYCTDFTDLFFLSNTSNQLGKIKVYQKPIIVDNKVYYFKEKNIYYVNLTFH